MSTVDKKVVEFELDNSNFERNARESINTINKLHESLNFDDVKGSIDAIANRFTWLSRTVMRSIDNITDSVKNFSIRFTKSLSVDNITSGWNNYANKTISVATMVSQDIKVAGKQIQNEAEKLEIINNQLEKLNWFTDQTSYSFTNMVDNIGKFTAAGQDLDASVNAMMGIANWAALSGQNAATASRAMYQLSQAMSKGYVQLIDYKSIQNANMDTQEFRKTVLSTAEALGELTKEGENYITKTGSKFTVNQFTEELNAKWFTSEVLTKSLQKYSAAVERIYEISEETGMTAAQVIARYGDELDAFGLKAFKAAQEARTLQQAIDATKDAVTTGWMTTAERIFGSYEKSKDLWTDLADGLYEVFAESGTLRNDILKVWNTLEGRNDLFKRGGKDQGAFWNLYDSIVAIIDLVKSSFNDIFPLSAFDSYNEKVDDLGNKFKAFTSYVKTYTNYIREAITDNEQFHNILLGVFSVLRVGFTIIQAVRFALEPLFFVIKNIVSQVLGFLSDIGTSLTQTEKVTDVIINAAYGISEALTKIFDGLNLDVVLDSVFDTVKALTSTFISLFKGLKDGFNTVMNGQNLTFVDTITSILQTVTSIILRFVNVIKNFLIPVISIVNEKVGNLTGGLIAVILRATNEIVKFIEMIFALVDGSLTFEGLINNIAKSFSRFSDILKTIAKTVSELFKINNGKVKEAGDGIFGHIKEYLNIDPRDINYAEYIQRILDALKPIVQAIIKLGSSLFDLLLSTGNVIAAVITVFADVIEMISKIDYDGIWEFVKSNWQWIALGAGIVALIGVIVFVAKKLYDLSWAYAQWTNSLSLMLQSLSDYVYTNNRVKLLNSVRDFLIGFSEAILKIAAALVLLGTLPTDKLALAAGVMAILLGFITVIVIYALQTSSKLNIATNSAKNISQSLKKITGEVKTNNLTTITAFIASLTTVIMALSGFMLVAGMLSMEKLIVATAALIAVMASFVGVIGVLSEIQKSTKANKARNEQLRALIGTLVVVMVAFAGLMLATEKVPLGNVISASLGIIGFIFSLAGALTIMSKVNFTKAQSEKLIAVIATLSGLMFTFASSIALLKNVPLEIIAVASTSIVTFMYGMVGVLALLSKIKVSPDKIALFALAVAAVSLSVISFSASLKLLEGNDLKGLVEGLGWFSLALIGLSVAAAVAGLAAPVILILGTSLIMLGLGLKLAADALVSFATYLVPFVEAMSTKFNDIIELVGEFASSMISVVMDIIPQLGELVNVFFTTILNLVIDLAPKVKDAALNIIDTVFTILEELVPRLFNFLTLLLNSVNQMVIDTTPSLVGTVVALIDAVLKQLYAHAKDWTGLLVDIINKSLEAVIERVPDIVSVCIRLLVALLDATGATLEPVIKAALRLLLNLIDSVGKAFLEMSDDVSHTLMDFGWNIGMGLLKGIGESIATLLSKIPMFGNDIADGFRKVFQINSPSKVFAEIGKYLMLGLNVGIDDNTDKVGDNAANAMSSVISKVTEAIDNGLDDDTLTITPVLDLSNVNSGVNNISELMSSISGGRVSVSSSMAAAASRELNRSKASENQNGNIINTTNSNDNYYTTFNVTTDDPEELARQTDAILQRRRYQANLAKGGL